MQQGDWKESVCELGSTTAQMSSDLNRPLAKVVAGILWVLGKGER
jgi:hypothetical protein